MVGIGINTLGAIFDRSTLRDYSFLMRVPEAAALTIRRHFPSRRSIPARASAHMKMTALLGVGHGRGLPSDRSATTDAGPLVFIVNWQALIKK
jgi:hypothetical protein